MALRWLESFDNLDTPTAGTILLTKYDSSRSATSPNVACSLAQSRYGRTLKIISQGTNVLTTNALGLSGTTFITGFGFYVTNSAFGAGVSGNGYLFDITEEDTTIHLRLALDSTGHFKVYRNTTLLGTSVTNITHSTWYYVEFKGLISDTVGTYEVRLDGTNILSGTGADTQNGGTGTLARAVLRGAYAGSFDIFFDDYYVCDATGVRNNDFLGSLNVGSTIMVADSIATGSNRDWTPSTGTDHGALVDDTPPNGDTDYNSSSTVGARDTYRMITPSIVSTTRGIQINRYIKKTDAGARTSGCVIRSGGANYDQTAQSPLTSYSFLTCISETDPATSALWTVTGLAAAEVGEKIVT